MRTRRASAAREPDLDPRDHLTPFVERHRDLFNAHILPKMKEPARACPCGRADEVPSCRIHYAVLHALNRTFRKLIPGFRDVMNVKNERYVKNSPACISKSALQYCICRNNREQFVKELYSDYRCAYMAGPFAAGLHEAVRTALSDAPVPVAGHETSCEECEADICVFCAAACAKCYVTFICRGCVDETPVIFIKCPSCARLFCDNMPCSDDIWCCNSEGCDALKCYECVSKCFEWNYCIVCDMTFCSKCSLNSDLLMCERCGETVCSIHNNCEMYMTNLADDEEDEELWYCNRCVPSPTQSKAEHRALTIDRANVPPQNATRRKRKSPSVSPRMSFSGDHEVNV